ncbi:MAG: hypothetical protein ACE5Q6_01580 [Dehalococcoidia bacterium]
MLNGFNPHLQERLRQAEQAESEVQRLESLAAEAPNLRAQVAKAQREERRERTRSNAMQEARRAMQVAAEKQAQVPGMLETACKLVYSLYALLKEIDAERKIAQESMAVVDRVDYEADMESAEAEQREVGRDPKGLEYVVASKHGQARIKRLLDELDPDFNYLKDCDLEDPMHRDVANFILAHVVSPTRTPLSAPPEPKAAAPQPEIQIPVGAPVEEES